MDQKINVLEHIWTFIPIAVVIFSIFMLSRIENSGNCPDGTGTPFELVISAYCNYGLTGVIFILLALIAFFVLIIQITKKFSKS